MGIYPDCPNCGATVESLVGYNIGGKTADGYRCADCDVSWTWDEWNNDVAKLSDDSQHHVLDREEGSINHAYTDLCNGVEEGVFAVETPRVHAETSVFDGIEISLTHDTSRKSMDGTIEDPIVGRPYLQIQLEWCGELALAEDLRQHSALEGPCILYGDIHLWRMEEPDPIEVGMWTDHDTSGATAEFEWYGTDPIDVRQNS